MGVTADVVGVRMEADTAAYINNIKIAEGTFLKSMQKMGAEAVLTGNASAVAFQKTGNAALKTSKDTQVLASSMKSLNGTTGNIAAQFNDIGVQLAGGQSFLLIALQQGTQLSQVFNQLRENGGGIGSSLTAAFQQALNPISLLTIGVIALGGYAVQYFMSVIQDGGAANLTLKEQEQIIRAVADRWGDAVPSLKAYVDELDRAKNTADDLAAQKLFNDQAFETPRQQIEVLQGSIGALVVDLRAAGEEDENILNLQKAFDEVKKAVDDGKDSTEALQKLQKALADTVYGSTIPSFQDFTTGLYSFAAAAKKAYDETAKLNAELKARELLAARQGIGGPLVYENDGGVPDGTAPIPEKRPSTEGMYENGGWNKPAKGRTKKDTEDSYESFTRKIKEQTSALEAETEAQAKVNVLQTDYGFAADAARLYQEGLNAAKKAGIELGPAEQESLRLLTEGLALVRVEQAKLDEEQKKTKQSFEAWNETAKSAVGGLIDDMLAGASAAELLKNALGKVLDQLIEIGLNKVFDSKSGILSALFSSFAGGSTGGKVDPWAGMRANGGPVSAGKPYLVGERGAETFVPHSAGSIIPNTPNIAGPGGNGGSGGQITVRTFMDENGAWQQRVENIAGNVAVKHVQRSQAGEISRLPNNLKAVNQRGMIKGK